MKNIPVLFLLICALSGQAQNYSFSTLAGLAGSSGNADGTGSAARFAYPYGLAVDSANNLYVADANNYLIRKIAPGGVVSTVASFVNLAGGYPTGVAVDSAGNIYVADTSNHIIRKITPNGTVTTLAGSPGSSGSVDGTGSDARFNSPRGIAVDSGGNVYVADANNSTIRKITTNGVVSTLAGLAGASGSGDGTGNAARFYLPEGVAVDNAGNVYVADTFNRTVRKITSAGVVSTLAGSAGVVGSADGAGSAALFFGPRCLAVDTTGNVYVSDNPNNTIRRITPAGVVSTLAGSAGSAGSIDGVGTAARFSGPNGVAVDTVGRIYVADGDNFTVRLGLVPPPNITTQPQSQTVVMGQTATLNVAATGTPPLNYQWRIEGAPITGATNVPLSLTNIQPSQAGNYSVIVSNFFGSVTSAVATVTVLVPPSVVTSPLSQSVVQGGSASFSATASGSAPFTYQWRFNGGNLTGANGATLPLSNVQGSQGGAYDVIVSNAAGSITSAPPASLTVITPPQIGTQPIGRTFSLGETVTLSVGASGIGLNYQWQLNGTNIPGATSATLSLTNLSLASAGAYRVVVTNAAGSATSDAARLNFVGLNLFPVLTIADVIGTSYRIDVTSDLASTNNWTTLTNLTLQSSPYLFIDTSTPQAIRRYYRAIAVP